jgi:hypothetical protein
MRGTSVVVDSTSLCVEDWFTRRGDEAGSCGSVEERLGFGLLKAPVEDRWSFSYNSCSALGRRGGAGPGVKELI